MGTSSSKSGSANNEYKAANGAASPDQKKTPTQTSLYGWGRMKHPLKPGRNNKTGEPQTDKAKGKKQPKQNGFQVNEIRMPDSKTTTTTVSAGGDHADGTGSTTPNAINGAATHKDEEIKENGNHTETETGTRDENSTPTPTTPRSGSPLDSASATTPANRSTTPFRKQVLSTPSFYGHYRCPSCSKYWRSGHSKEGCAQNCTKCGTPTIPRR